MDKKLKFFAGRVKSIDAEKKTARVVISDESKDRHHERVLVSSFTKTKKDFMKHPVLLSSHAYRGLMMNIGQFNKLTIDTEAKEVVGDIEYYVGKGNPEADWAWVLAEKGIAAFSIGFIPKVEKYYEDEERAKNGGIYCDYEEIELLEVSQVLIPANPSALQKSFESEDIESEELDEMVQRLYESNKEFFEEKKEPVEEVPEVVVEEKEEVVSEVKSDGIKELLEELLIKVGVLGEQVTRLEAKFTNGIDKEEEIEDNPNKDIPEEAVVETTEEDLLGEEKMAELLEELKKLDSSHEPTLEEVKNLFEEMNSEIKATFSVQS